MNTNTNHANRVLYQMKHRYALYVRIEFILIASAVLIGFASTLYFAHDFNRHAGILIAFFCVEAILISIAFIIYYGFLTRLTTRFTSALSELDDICEKLGMTSPENAEDLSGLLNTVVEIVEDGVRRESRSAFLQQQAELHALQSQINPHFLYNSLETIRGEMLSRGHPDVAEMTEKLARFFRYNISRKGDLVELKEELKNLENYIAIQQYRFGSRIGYSIEYHTKAQQVLNCLMPKLTLQPLVENAIIHGLDPKLEGGSIVVHIDATDKNLIITVSDDGTGMDSDTLNTLRRRLAQSESDSSSEFDKAHVGIAITNINLRLKMLWGNAYGIMVSSTKMLGTDVELTMPVVYKSVKNPQ